MPRDRFVNPANGQEYIWHQAHSEEEEFGKTRNIQARGTTGKGRVLHEGSDEPMRLRWSGTYQYRAQHTALWTWFRLCDTQTIHLYDYDGQGYEVTITDFKPKRRRKLSFTGKDAGVPHHFWEYTIEFLVVRFLNGDMLATGVQP